MKHYCEFAVRALPSLALLLYLLNNTISYYSIYSIRLPTVIDRKFGSHLCCEASGYALPYEKVVSLLVRQHGGGWALWQMKDGSPWGRGQLLVPYQLHHFSSRMRQPSHLGKSSGLWLARKERKEDMETHPPQNYASCWYGQTIQWTCCDLYFQLLTTGDLPTTQCKNVVHNCETLQTGSARVLESEWYFGWSIPPWHHWNSQISPARFAER